MAAAVAILTLAVGIAANTALFSVLDAVVLQPLPVKEPARLVKLIQVSLETGGRYGVPYHNYLFWRERSESFEELARFITRGYSTP